MLLFAVVATFVAAAVPQLVTPQQGMVLPLWPMIMVLSDVYILREFVILQEYGRSLAQ
jgi:hypothetical protein